MARTSQPKAWKSRGIEGPKIVGGRVPADGEGIQGLGSQEGALSGSDGRSELDVSASTTLSWTGKISVNCVIRNTLRIFSCTHANCTDPSFARAFLRAPTRAPNPVESINPT